MYPTDWQGVGVGVGLQCCVRFRRRVEDFP